MTLATTRIPSITNPGELANILNDNFIRIENELRLTIQNIYFPVGSNYTSYTNTANPAAILGFGTWVTNAGPAHSWNRTA